MPSSLIQWFPGHMAKTRRLIKENLKYIDIVIEVRDARIPQSSANPELPSLIGSKPLLTVFSKSSLADPAVSKLWKDAYTAAGLDCLFIDSLSGEGISKIKPSVDKILCQKLARYAEKGMHGRTLKAMIVGIPNVGKSCLINKISASKKAKVENRPGVTLTKQWVTTTIGLDLMDMPGVLWPKFEDQSIGEKLAICGSIKDEILDSERLAVALCKRYRLPEETLAELDDHALFLDIGKRRGMMLRGGEIDTERCSKMLLEEFRSATIGRLTLERPQEKCFNTTKTTNIDTGANHETPADSVSTDA